MTMPINFKKIRQVRRAMLRHQKDTGFSMTIRELMEKVDISSTSLASYYIYKLIEMGLAKKRGNQFRAIARADAVSVKKKINE